MRTNQLLLILTFFLGAQNIAYGSETYTIHGKIIDSGGTNSLSMPIVLLEGKMGGEPVITPIMKTVSNDKGRYQFTLNERKTKVFYKVSTILNEQVVHSKLIILPKNIKTIQLDLHLPITLQGYENFSFFKNVLIFDQLENSIRITDIIALVNNSGGTVDTKKQPLIRNLPKNAINIQFPNSSKGTEISFDGERLFYKLLLPEGNHQLYVTYEIPIDQETLSFEIDLPPKTQQMELVIPGNSLNINFDQISNSVIKNKKQFANELFFSKIISLNANQQKVSVIIQDLPISQFKLLYPAALLLISLSGGLIFYLLQQSTTNASS